jgi:hypothetical protein
MLLLHIFQLSSNFDQGLAFKKAGCVDFAPPPPQSLILIIINAENRKKFNLTPAED